MIISVKPVEENGKEKFGIYVNGVMFNKTFTSKSVADTVRDRIEKDYKAMYGETE